MTTEHQADRFVLISADGHAGGNHDQYRAYLEAKYLDDFDAWRGRYSNPFKDLTGGTRNRNWDDERRLSELEQDGVVAEVLFPNTIPPFFPTGAVVARPPTPDDYDARGWRGSEPTIGGWPIGAPGTLTGGPESVRYSSTTSTMPSLTSAGATSMACAEVCSSSPCRTT